MTDNNTCETYKPLPISTDDYLRLKAAVSDRDPKLRLTLRHTDDGADFVSVTSAPIFCRGEAHPVAIVIRAALSTAQAEGRRPPVRDGSGATVGWMVHSADIDAEGPLFEFTTTSEVAAFLASGTTTNCRRSSTARNPAAQRADRQQACRLERPEGLGSGP